jgi:hypothetical protein
MEMANPPIVPTIVMIVSVSESIIAIAEADGMKIKMRNIVGTVGSDVKTLLT